MATIVSTGFEHDLTGGIGFGSTNHPENILKDSSVFRHGAYSMKVTGSTSFSVFASSTIAQRTVTGRVYLRIAALPTTGQSFRFVKCNVAASDFHLAVIPNGKIQHTITGTDGTPAATVMSLNTWYLVDFRFDTTGTTYTADVRVSDTDGVVLSTATQLTKTGQTAADMTTFSVGQHLNFAGTAWFDDATITNSAADYPLGAGIGNDGLFDPITTFEPSWIDDQTRIQNGALFGMMTLNTGSGDNGQTAAAEGPTKANRRVYVVQSFYSNVQTTGTMAYEHQIQNGSLLGHQMWPMIHPFGFGSTTVNWPAAGLAAFTNGSQDAYLDAWVSVWNAQLSPTPFLVRPFREMTNNVTIYGRNGSSVGGLNETTSSFIAAWRYIDTYWRTRVPMYRSVWCPDTNTTPSDTFTWYPGNAYVDWIGADAYGTSTNTYNPAPALTAHHDAYKTGGTLGLSKPLMVCETSIQKTDPSRITDFQAYTATFTTLNKYKVVNVWDSAPAGPYYVDDTPPGFLSAFQGVVGSPPFTGTIGAPRVGVAKDIRVIAVRAVG